MSCEAYLLVRDYMTECRVTKSLVSKQSFEDFVTKYHKKLKNDNTIKVFWLTSDFVTVKRGTFWQRVKTFLRTGKKSSKCLRVFIIYSDVICGYAYGIVADLYDDYEMSVGVPHVLESHDIFNLEITGGKTVFNSYLDVNYCYFEGKTSVMKVATVAHIVGKCISYSPKIKKWAEYGDLTNIS